MFKAANPYDEVVIKATDENLTSEQWELNLDVCDKVSGEGEAGARNCILAIQKRLVHRSANVQLYALTLSDMLSKNCGIDAHRELASRAFTATLVRLVSDRNTHDKVKRRALELIRTWTEEWDGDDSLGLIKETAETLKRQGFSFEEEPAPPPPEPSSEALRAEDEELRKVLELSLRDQGGRAAAFATSYPAESSAAGSSSSAAAVPSTSTAASQSAGRSSTVTTQQSVPDSSGYVAPTPSARTDSLPAQASSSAAANANLNKKLPEPTRQSAITAADSAQAQPAAKDAAPSKASRVRAIFDLTRTNPGELEFQKGDVIRVLENSYEHWWKGECRGEIGLFPLNYVEILPDPTPLDIQREAELEARIFAQASSIDALLSKLRSLDPGRDNLAEDDELQELYQTSLSMRPRIVRLIDRYSTKIAELKAMNEKFVRARGIFDGAMEESLARHQPGSRAQEYTQIRPDVVENLQRPGVQGVYQDYSREWAEYYAQQARAGQHPGQPQPVQPQPHQGQPQATPQAAPQAQTQPHPQDPAYAQWYWSQPQHQQQLQQLQQAQQTQQQQSSQHVQQPSNEQVIQQQQYAPPGPAQVQSQSSIPQVTVQPPSEPPSANNSVGPQLTEAFSCIAMSSSAPNGTPSAAQASSSSSHAQDAAAFGNLPTVPSTDLNAPQDDEKRRLYEKARREAEQYHSQWAQNAAPGGSGVSVQPQQPPVQQAQGQPQAVLQ